MYFYSGNDFIKRAVTPNAFIIYIYRCFYNSIINKISLLGFIGIVWGCLGCNPHKDYALKFEIRNNTDSSVYFAFSYSYPDTSLSKVVSVPYYSGNVWQKLLAHEGKYEGRGEFNLNQTTLVFIFDAHTIDTTPWDKYCKAL